MVTSAASAATVVETASGTFGGGRSFTVAVNQFDASLGTLQSVDIEVDGILSTRVSASGSASCFHSPWGGAPMCMGTMVSATSRGASLNVVGDAWAMSATGSLATSSCYAGTASGCTTSAVSTVTIPWSSLAGSESGMRTLTGGDVTGYIGSGTMDFVFSSDNPGSVSNGSGGSVSVTYTYAAAAAVPIPASGLLLLGGIAGLGALRARRRSDA